MARSHRDVVGIDKIKDQQRGNGLLIVSFTTFDRLNFLPKNAILEVQTAQVKDIGHPNRGSSLRSFLLGLMRRLTHRHTICNDLSTCWARTSSLSHSVLTEMSLVVLFNQLGKKCTTVCTYESIGVAWMHFLTLSQYNPSNTEPSAAKIANDSIFLQRVVSICLKMPELGVLKCFCFIVK